MNLARAAGGGTVHTPASTAHGGANVSAMSPAKGPALGLTSKGESLAGSLAAEARPSSREEGHHVKNRALQVVAFIAGALLVPMPASSQEVEPEQTAVDPLAPFERFVGGQWHLEGSYQEFEWGVGRRVVRSRGYFLEDGKPKLVAEGIWFWHPGEKRIKGIFAAIDMPVVFFDYTTRFEGSKMVSDLRSYGAKGTESTYVETWDFKDDTHFVWKLMKQTPEGLREEMGGTYTRK